MRKQRICLLFSDTGGGHRSACEAIRQALEDLGSKVESDWTAPELVVESIVEKTNPLNRWFVELYNYILRHNQAGMKYYYWFIEQFKPNDSELGYQMAKPYLTGFLKDFQPTVVVSVHPMSNHYVARAMQDIGMAGNTKMVTVVTDPNGDFWRGWACPSSDLTIVPNALGRDRLVGWGIEPAKIKVLGMPVHPDFVKEPSTTREDFLRPLGLHSELLTICINAGWAGGGNSLEVYRQMALAALPVQVIFLCGHNQELYQTVKSESVKYSLPTAVLPFHDRMSDLMSSVDLMVTKAGGLTCYESLARRLPMAIDMITEPMPQERGTAKLLCSEGLASPLYRPEDIVPVLADLSARAEKGESMDLVLPEYMSLDKVDAAYNIAQEILELSGVKLRADARKEILNPV